MNSLSEPCVPEQNANSTKKMKTCANANEDERKLIPRFLVINNTTDEIKKMSPFLIQKLIKSCAGEPKNIKRLRSGDLLVETLSSSQSATLLSLNKLGNVSVTVSPHKSLNYSRGVISEFDLLCVSEEEFVSELSHQNVCAARRIKVRREGKLIDTKNVILTFNTPELPKSVRAGYLHCPVRPYIPNPMRCFQCQRFGHSKMSCRGKPTCARCSVEGHDSDSCKAVPLCVNCKGEHTAFSRSCPKWKAEKEVQSLKVTKNLTYAEARKIIASTHPRLNVSYAEAAKKFKTVGIQTNLSNLCQKINNQRENTSKITVIEYNAGNKLTN
ncbi:uncharacterized protein LOC118188158 [Stegodyphus dumicola]|uniref:uncharacterized protein LOC118188158 n=1 Tax=Stegodyphus dumicola TaxID=202533 RepID=UPI0015A7EE45|nr:uncharacterized protein LOC118188158 [Stegodyphus dumicola]